MEATFENLWGAIQAVLFQPAVWGVILLAAVYGVFMGGIPGLTATMAVALVVPVTFFMDTVPALAAVVTLVACAIFAGDIPNALLRIPGTPASAAYTEDLYSHTKRGEPSRGLGLCLTFSVIGGLFGAIVLMLFAQPLAALATQFSVAEYFWLYLLGLSCAVIVSRGSRLRATLALIIGLLLSTVGLSAVHTEARFTFGQAELYQGINFIPAMIGLFGLSEILRNVVRLERGLDPEAPTVKGEKEGKEGVWSRYVSAPLRSVFQGNGLLAWRRKWHALRSGVIGSVIGMLPGAGADIGSWVSLAASKRSSKRPQDYGKGSTEGIGDATMANSSALAGAWIPALVFGIPGDSVTAIVIGVLLMKNVSPGPNIFAEQGELVFSIYLMFIVANLILLPVGFAAIKAGGRLVRVPRRILMPIILLFCIIGAYAINGSYFDVGVMAAMGILGFVLERLQVPLGPVVLGIILGGPLEAKLINTLTQADGSLVGFVSRPTAAILALITLFVWSMPAIKAWRKQ